MGAQAEHRILMKLSLDVACGRPARRPLVGEQGPRVS